MKKEDLEEFQYIPEICIELLREYSTFKDEFKTFAPSIESDIESSSLYSNCSCNNTIKNFVRANRDACINFLCDYLKERPHIHLDLEMINEKYTPNIISGRIAKTSIKEWSDFCKKMKESNASYTSFSVFKDGDDLLVFFL